MAPVVQISVLLASRDFGITAKRIEPCRELGDLASKTVVENPRPLSAIETVPVQYSFFDVEDAAVKLGTPEAGATEVGCHIPLSTAAHMSARFT
jgi:hypothetical protein